MKQTRNSVFETNSSSTHSISLTGSGTIKIPNGMLELVCAEYGWEEETYNDPQSKLSYVLTAIQYHTKQSFPDNVLNSTYLAWIKEVLNDVGIVYYPEQLEADTDGYSEFGYIDHQATDTMDDLWSDDKDTFKNNMKEFIFNPSWELRTGNDNC